MIKKSKAVRMTALLFNWRLYYYYSFPVSCLLFYSEAYVCVSFSSFFQFALKFLSHLVCPIRWQVCREMQQ